MADKRRGSMDNNENVNPISAIAVANFFIKKARENKQEITPMQLLKLVYIAHGWSLGILDRPLIKNEIEAWRYGPVIPDLYHEFKEYRDKNITNYGSDIIWSPDLHKFIEKVPEQIEDQDNINLLDRVWDVYRKFTGWQLSAITHQDNTPWSIVWNNFGKDNNFGNATIEDDIIKDHYKKLMKDREQKEV